MAVALRKWGPFQGTVIYGWDLASGETGTPTPWVGQFPDKSVHIYGTFNSSNITIQGKMDNDGVTWTSVPDTSEVAIVETADIIVVLGPNVGFVRPVAGTVTAVSVRLICSAARSRST